MNKSLSALALLILLALPGRAADPAATPGDGAALAAAAATPAAWKEYPYKDDKMAITLPGEPQVANQTVVDAGLKIPVRIFTLKTDACLFLLTSNEYPADAVAKSSPEQIMKNARDGALESMNAKVISEKNITIDNNPGIEFNFASDTVRGTIRVYFVGTHLYQIGYATPAASDVPADGVRFLNSFRLLK